MRNSERYRANGLECDRIAQQTRSPADRLCFRQMATDWRLRAEAAEILECDAGQGPAKGL